MSDEEFRSYCKDICPHCKADAPIRQREDTREFVHDIITELPIARGKSHVHIFCIASHFRNKWQGQLGG